MSAAVLRSGAEGKRAVESEQKPLLSGRGEKGGWLVVGLSLHDCHHGAREKTLASIEGLGATA